MSLSRSTKGDLARIAALAALAAYVVVLSLLFHIEARMKTAAEDSAREELAAESESKAMSSSLGSLERAGNPLPSLSAQVQKKRDAAEEKRVASGNEYETWKTQSEGWVLKRWVVLALASLAFLPVVVWGFQHWGTWARDKRLSRSQEK